MRSWILALIAALVVAVPLARAQDADWTDPTGRMSLTFEALDWSAAPESVAAQGGYLLLLFRNDMPRDRRARVCGVMQRPQPQLAGGTQTDINATLEAWTPDLLRQRLGAPVADFQRLQLGSIAVLDYTVQMQGLQQHTRTFVLARDGEATLFDITCGVPAPATPDELASMTAVLNSLSIAP